MMIVIAMVADEDWITTVSRVPIIMKSTMEK